MGVYLLSGYLVVLSDRSSFLAGKDSFQPYIEMRCLLIQVEEAGEEDRDTKGASGCHQENHNA